jgi:hypothetical protein
MLIFGYLGRPTETTSSGLHIGASELGPPEIYSAAGIHWFEKQLSPIFTDLHRLGGGRESKLLFHRRNKKIVAARTHIGAAIISLSSQLPTPPTALANCGVTDNRPLAGPKYQNTI